MTDYPDCGCYCPAGMFLADDKCVTMDEGGYIVYVDVNGNSGDSILYEDVFPFYLTLSAQSFLVFRKMVVSVAATAKVTWK